VVERYSDPRGPQARDRLIASKLAQRVYSRHRVGADLGGTYNNQRDRSTVQLSIGRRF